MNNLKDKFQLLLKPYMGLPKEVYVIFVARIINAMGALVFPLMTLILTEKIGMSKGEAGLWISISGLMFGPASIIGGKFTDIIGRKLMIVIFDTLGAFTYLAVAFVEPSMTTVYLVMTAGFFMGFAGPAHDALIADVTTPENRSGAYSLTYLGFNLGFIVGPVIGGFLFNNYFHWIFIIDAITALSAVALVSFFIKETFDKSEQEDLGDDRKMEEKVEGSVFKVILSRPILIYFALVIFGYNFVYSQWSFMIPLHTEHNFADQGAELFGQLAGFNGLIVILFTPIITSLFVKKQNIRRIIYGGILYVIGFGMLGFVSTKIAFFSSIFIFTLGEILITISAAPFIANHTPASHRGRMSSILFIIMGLGFTLGPVTMGRIADIVQMEIVWRYIGAFMFIFTLFAILLEKADNRNNVKQAEKNNTQIGKNNTKEVAVAAK